MMKYTLALLAAVAAVEASPFPQAVTAAISPSAAAPPGCTPTYVGSFGILNVNVSSPSTAAAKRQATQIGDGQPQAPTNTVSGAVTQISDAQPQAATSVNVMTGAMVSMINDGQVQGGMHTQMVMPVSQISDGQIQGATVTIMPVSVISDGQPQAPGAPITATVVPASQISDGQPQASTAVVTPASQISDGQPQASTAVVTPASQISDGQPQASTVTGVSQTSDAQPQASTSGAASSQPTQLAFCKESDSLTLTLSDGILKDGQGRTGYIASNYQFQFDDPPQAGAIYTSGFSVCANGTLSLGGSSIFYQCLSGNFYNLYDRNWAAQCNAIYIQTGPFVNC